MILFITLTIIAIILAVFAVLTLAVGGTTFLLIFGDIIVCIFIIVMILRCIFKK